MRQSEIEYHSERTLDIVTHHVPNIPRTVHIRSVLGFLNGPFCCILCLDSLPIGITKVFIFNNLVALGFNESEFLILSVNRFIEGIDFQSRIRRIPTLNHLVKLRLDCEALTERALVVLSRLVSRPLLHRRPSNTISSLVNIRAKHFVIFKLGLCFFGEVIVSLVYFAFDTAPFALSLFKLYPETIVSNDRPSISTLNLIF